MTSGDRVYLDTSALLPLLDADDRDHRRVVEALSRLAEDAAELVTTSYTVVEAGALVRSRLGVAAFRALGEVLSRTVEIRWVDADLHRRAWDETARGGRDGPSLVDVTGFLVMEDEGVTRALALDRHFRDRGFETLP